MKKKIDYWNPKRPFLIAPPTGRLSWQLRLFLLNFKKTIEHNIPLILFYYSDYWSDDFYWRNKTMCKIRGWEKNLIDFPTSTFGRQTPKFLYLKYCSFVHKERLKYKETKRNETSKAYQIKISGGNDVICFVCGNKGHGECTLSPRKGNHFSFKLNIFFQPGKWGSLTISFFGTIGA